MAKKIYDKKINDTHAEINLKVLENNFDIIKKVVNKNRSEPAFICSIIKANGYGHGMNEIGKALSGFGTDYLGTADYNESIILYDYLKKYSKKKIPILCLGILTEPEKYFEEIIARNIEVTIADVKMAALINEFAKGRNKIVNVHVQVDSGIHRIGFLVNDAYNSIEKLKEFPNLNVKGIYSHFAMSEKPDHPYARKQLKNFKALIRELENNVMKFELKHICNTGGILNYNDHFFNMVRPGISLYGYYPSRRDLVSDIGLKPVMTLRSKVKYIKMLDKNESISYGREYFTDRRTKIASIPVGYGDGYSRLLTNKSKVVINKKLFNTVGAVCMDWVMAELGTNTKTKLNDEVILFGKEYPADNLAEIMGTIPYEITCNISSRVQRVYVYN